MLAILVGWIQDDVCKSRSMIFIGTKVALLMKDSLKTNMLVSSWVRGAENSKARGDASTKLEPKWPWDCFIVSMFCHLFQRLI